jgi:hypothetical protein
MEAVCSSETSAGFQQTARLYIPDDNYSSKKLNSCRRDINTASCFSD